MSVGKPTADRDSMLRVEYVGGRGVVNDDCLFKVTTDLGEILKQTVG